MAGMASARGSWKLVEATPNLPIRRGYFLAQHGRKRNGSPKLRNLEAAFAMFAAYYNYCWQTRRPGKSGKKRPTACMMAKLTGHVWSFDELFETVLRPTV